MSALTLYVGFGDSLSNRLLSVYCKGRLAVRIDQPHVQSVDEQLTLLVGLLIMEGLVTCCWTEKWNGPVICVLLAEW